MPVATITAQPRAATGLGPLTTAFAAPTSCAMTKENLVLGSQNVYWQLGPTETDQGCYPPNWVLGGYYSPGICPVDYTAACSSTDFNDVGTTLCCPNHGEYFCASSHPSGREESIFGCSSEFDSKTTRTQEDRTTVATGGIFWAHSVQVRNLDATSTVTSTTTAPAEATSHASESSSTSISDGAIAGTAVGSAAAGALMAAGAFFLWRRWKNQRQPQTVQQQDFREIAEETPSSPRELGHEREERRNELQGQPRWGLPLLPSPSPSVSPAQSRPWQPPQELNC